MIGRGGDFSINPGCIGPWGFHVEGYEDMAYVRGGYLMEFIPEGSPKPIVDRGNFLEIIRKQDNGSWPISVDIWNSDQM